MSEKEAYQEKLQAKLDQWRAEIDKLEAKIDQAKADAKINYQKQIEELRAKYGAAKEKLAEVKQAGDGTWKNFKRGIENTWKELGDAVDSAIAKFK